MPTQLINPNAHVILIHVPIGMLMVGTLIELLAFMWRGSSFRAAGRWMILIGALGSIPAATSGMYAARQAMHVADDATLSQLKEQAAFSADQWDLLRHHILYNGLAAGLLGALVIVWLGASDEMRRRAHFIYLAALLIAVGLITAGAWRGGEMVYAHNIGSHLVKGGWPKSAETEKSTAPASTTPVDNSKWAFEALRTAAAQAQKIDDVTDTHVVLAGWVAALAVATLGLSIRGLWLNPNRPADESYANDDDIVNAIAGRGETRGESRGEKRSLMNSPEDQVSSEYADTPVRVPAARFWLLAALLGIVTALVGWMILGPGSLKEAIDLLKSSQRYMAHSIVGGSIVVLTLMLALVTRFAPYNRIGVAFFSLLLTLALAAQVWLGVLLMFDTNEGPIQKFNAPATQPTPPSNLT